MADTRSKREKLEAMANQSASPREAEVARTKLKKMASEPSHPIFARRQRYDPFGVDTDSMQHEDFMDWADRVWKAQKHTGFRDPEPHEYVAHRGSDALGCAHCGRSKDNPRAHHIKVIS